MKKDPIEAVTFLIAMLTGSLPPFTTAIIALRKQSRMETNPCRAHAYRMLALRIYLKVTHHE